MCCLKFYADLDTFTTMVIFTVISRQETFCLIRMAKQLYQISEFPRGWFTPDSGAELLKPLLGPHVGWHLKSWSKLKDMTTKLIFGALGSLHWS
mmetsp:Transcript_10403/g.27557  ORF Transcript_10403/g.27557 Transcript_10403/m.27557 type:complete len:94 (+) Transcript_10403:470-751(+)